MPTLARLTRLPVLAVSYAFLRAAAVWGIPPATFPDSAGYQRLDLSSPIARTWPVPLPFTLVRSDSIRVALHVILGVLAWSWLARSLGRHSKFPRLMWILVFVVGLTPQVVRYDLTILSESLANSSAVMVTAATFDVLEKANGGTRTRWLIMFVIFAMVRPQHLLLLFAAAMIVIIRWAARQSMPSVLGATLLLVATVGFAQLRANSPTSDLNLYTVVTERVLTDDARFAWFVDHGMPDIPGMRLAQSYDYVEQVPADLLAFLQLPVGQAPPSLVRVGGMPFAEWVRNEGWSTYARFVLTHPSDTKARVLDLASPTLDPVNDDFLPLASRRIVFRWLFAPWKICAVLTAAGVLCAVLTGRLRRAGALAAMFTTAAVIYCAAMLTSGIEHQRHASLVAVLVRVCALAGVAELLRREVNADASSSAPPAG